MFDKIDNLFFLDGGNGGYKQTLPTNNANIQHISQYLYNNNNIKRNNPIGFHIYGTSYQWNDKSRKWIELEKDIFVKSLKKNQLKCDNNMENYRIHYKLYNDSEFKTFKTGINPDYGMKPILRHFLLLKLFNVNLKKFLL